MQQSVVGVVFVLVLDDFASMLLHHLQQLHIPVLCRLYQLLSKSHNSFLQKATLLSALTLSNMALQVFDVDLEFAVGTLGDVLETVNQVQLIVLPVYILRTTLSSSLMFITSSRTAQSDSPSP